MSEDDSEELASLRRQLVRARENLRLIQVRKSQYAMEEDIPLNILKNEERLKKEIARLEQARQEQGNEADLKAANARLYAENAQLQEQVDQLMQENEQLRAAVAPDSAMDDLETALADVLRHGRILAVDLSLTIDVVLPITHVRNYTRTLTSALARAHTRALDRVRELALDRSYVIALDDAIYHTRNLGRERSIGAATTFDPALTSVSNLTNNIFTSIQKVTEEVLGADHPEVVNFKKAVEEFNRWVNEKEKQQAGE